MKKFNSTKEVISHLLNSFDYFKGVPEEIVIDQDNLMVMSENAGDIIYTDDFKYFILFVADPLQRSLLPFLCLLKFHYTFPLDFVYQGISKVHPKLHWLYLLES